MQDKVPNSILLKIKQKKPLQNLDNDIILEQINLFFKQNAKLKSKLQKNKLEEKHKKQILKFARNNLNKTYGQFWKETHLSLEERRSLYPKIYEEIFKITGRPKSILDLASGLNAETYKYYPEIEWHSIELTESDCQKIREIYKRDKIKGKVAQQDITKNLKFPKADLTILWKFLDLIPHKTAESIVVNLSPPIVVSFSTKSIKQRRMSYPRRGWFEQMLKRLNLPFVKIIKENELFYIIKSQK